jgi:hypothetical protein
MTNNTYPDLKPTDRVGEECGRCVDGVYTGPSNASWNNGNGNRTWCFYCGGAGYGDLYRAAWDFIGAQRTGDPLLRPLQLAADDLGIFAKADDAIAQAVRDAMAAFDARRTATSNLPTGRAVIRGEVLTTKSQDSAYGTVYKMLVQADGYRVWGTIPSGIYPRMGDVVEFTAAVTASDDDPNFGFYSRPTKAAVVETATEA